jgi:trimethylamine:corrinoid methyltransferase-like protein
LKRIRGACQKLASTPLDSRKGSRYGIILDEISLVSPGGSFFSAPSTLRNFKTGYYTSPIFPHWTIEKWQAKGTPDAKGLLRKYTQHLIQTALPPEDHEELIRKGEAFILRNIN